MYSRFGPAFRAIARNREREHFLNRWLKSEFFLRSGLDAESFREKVSKGVWTEGAFLRQLMESICLQQGATRWAECTPDHGLYIRRIKRDFPDALFIHIIRDGRDVALSLARKKFVAPLPWGRDAPEVAAATYWAWITSRTAGAECFVRPDYLAIHYEDLVNSFEKTLQQVAAFIGQSINISTIASHPIGSVAQPNTSFDWDKDEHKVGASRWRSQCDPELLRKLEGVAGKQLRSFGYELSHDTLASSSKLFQSLALRSRFELGRLGRLCGLGGDVRVASWDDVSAGNAVDDPTLRPGENLGLIRRLVTGTNL